MSSKFENLNVLQTRNQAFQAAQHRHRRRKQQIFRAIGRRQDCSPATSKAQLKIALFKIEIEIEENRVFWFYKDL